MTIHEACRRGDLDAVCKFVANDPASVNLDDQYEWRPIFHAALCRHLAVVEFLIESGADLAAHNGYALHYAAEVPDNHAIVKLLIQYGALDAHTRPTSDLSRQLLSSIFLSDAKRVGALLRLFPDLARVVDGCGDEPIHHAARNGESEIVQLLIDHGADVNAIGHRNHTVLYCAGGHGHVATVRELLRRGADVHAKFGDGGETLLDWLAQFPDDNRFVKVTAALREHIAANEG